MITKNITDVFQNLDRLIREIEEDATIGPKFISLFGNKNGTNFEFDNTFDSSDENYLIHTFLDSFIDEDNSHDITPKIVSLTQVKKTDFREIDYKTEVDVNLYPKRTFVRGELTLVEWFKNLDQNGVFSDLVLKVEMVYVRDPFGFPLTRTTTRTWINNNETENPLQRITYKNYAVSPLAQIEEGLRRRGNIVNSIQLPTMGLMIEALSPPPYNLTQDVILFMGREFLDRFEGEFDRFVKNSSTVTDLADPNFGRKTVVVELEDAAATTDLWLNETPASLQGASILQYLKNEFVDES